MYRPELKIIDCTIRDGGLMNKWDFSHDVVRQIYKANVKAGVDYMEIGYKASTSFFDPKEYGPWRFCNEEDLKIVTDGIETEMKLCMMVDIGRCSDDDIPLKSDSLIDTIRIACYAKEIDTAISLANSFEKKGYEVFINIMAISTTKESVLDECLHQVENETNVKGIYIVDSFGSLDLEDIQFLIKKYRGICKTKELGFHGHNNQQLAFANTMMSIINGVNYLDASYYGMGRGAGNCPMELLISYLKNPKFDVTPILEQIDNTIEPLMSDLKWGYHIPYAMTGVLNRHPRSAMEFMKNRDGKDFHQFYNSLIGDDDSLV